MSKAAQLKRKAAEFEQKRQYDRALATYVQAIEAAAGIPDELDIPLYNRVGDLYLRMGDLDKAVSYYETAVDLYAEGGFFNNAIALCNKVLRHAPKQTVVYYKLGKISARKGFTSDAKQNFLEYASRTERAGDISEAFRALKEFADLCPGQDDVRLMLAEQLARADRITEALEQLETVYDAMLADDRGTEAAATLERIRAIDPEFQPRATRSHHEQKREGLVFIDVDYQGPRDEAPDGRMEGMEPTSLAGGPESRPLSAERFGEVELPAPADARAERTLDESPLAGLTPLEDPMVTLASEAASQPEPPITEIEPTAYDDGSLSNMEMEPLAIESTSLDVNPQVTLHPENAGQGAPPSSAAWGTPTGVEPILSPEELSVLPEVHSNDSLADAVTGIVSSLASDVGEVEGGLPDDLGLLPNDAVDEQQQPPAAPPAAPSITARPTAAKLRSDDEFVDLNEWLRESERPKNPRMTGEDEEQDEGAVQTDFTSMLETFKRGVAENVDENDLDSHYDLGVAYKEMGLLDEAITQFQKAMRGDSSPDRRIRSYESLGQTFIEQGEYEIATQSLRGALAEPGMNDTKLVGVLYLLGYTAERLDNWRDAEGYYRRVFAVDIHFRDIAERLRRAELAG